MAKAPSLIVAKVGSSTLVDENGALDRTFIRSLCDQVVELAHEGTHVVLVSSGAAAAGRDELGLSERPSDIMTLQACAAAGQAKLTEAYADVLAERGIPCGQVLLTRRDVVVYDSEAHACIMDGLRLYKGKRFMYAHNDMESLRLQLKHATELAEQQGGGVLVITEGVFGMKGDCGKLDEIVALKKEFPFRLLVDDAHGFGTMGPGGRGTAAHYGVVDGVDVLFNTFAKSMAGIGAFVSGPKWLIYLLRYNMRSQLYAKSLPMPMVIGALKRLDLIRKHPEYQEKLWEITRALQGGLKKNGFDIGPTNSPVTPVYMKGGVTEATNLIVDLRENHNLFCSIVVYPVIPRGEIILRVIPTAAHTLEDVNYTIEAFKSVRDKLESGFYRDKPIPEGFAQEL